MSIGQEPRDPTNAGRDRPSSDGDPGPQPRAWYIDVPEAQCEAELRFLRTEIYRYEVDPPVRRIDAYDRFSDRI